MTKQEILDYFKDINFMYNNAVMHDILSGMLDKLLDNRPEVVRCKDCKPYMTIHCTCDGCCISADWFCADGKRR